MNQATNNTEFSLYKRPITDDIPEKNRFHGDLYERGELAKRLTSLLTRLPDGAVLSIDSPWGEGKTWFGKRWQASLGDEGYRTAYIDCFARDHVEDPFSMVTGELLELAKSVDTTTRTKLLNAGKKIATSLLPAAVKFAVNTAGHWAIGNADLAEDISKAAESIEQSGAEKLEKLVAKTLEDYEADKKTVDGFKQALAEVAAKEKKPIVIFVDELDRCRPDFAVRTIERIKHFFDVPGVIFVLLINRKQLNAAVRGLYGQDVDASSYLGKFINLALTLPKKSSIELDSPDDNRIHCEQTLLRYGFPQSNATSDFCMIMGPLAYQFEFSLRDIERAVVLYSFGQPINSTAAYVAWPIVLKIARPDLFAKLIANVREAHDDAYRLAANVRSKSPANIQPVLGVLEEMHNSGSVGFTKKFSEEHVHLLGGMVRFHGVQRFFTSLFERVDLSVSR